MTNLLFLSKLIKTKFTVRIRSELTLSQPSLSTPTDGLVKYLFGFSSSEYLNCGLHIWYVSTISLVNLATSCKLEGVGHSKLQSLSHIKVQIQMIANSNSIPNDAWSNVQSKEMDFEHFSTVSKGTRIQVKSSQNSSTMENEISLRKNKNLATKF